MLLPGGARERVVAQESEEVEPAPPREEALPVVLAGIGGGLMLVLSATLFCMRGRRRRATTAKEGEDVVQVL